MKGLRITLFLGFAVLVLAGCANQPLGPDPSREAVASTTPNPPSAEGEALYQILRGELAGKQGDLQSAADAYLKASRKSDDPRVARRAAQIALYANRENDALEAAKRWRSLSPGDPDPLDVLGLIYFRQGEFDKALEEFRAAVAASKGKTDHALSRVAALLGQEDNQSKAVELYSRLVAGYPEDADAYFTLAQFALQASEPRTAITAAEHALSLKPGWQDAQELRAKALLAADRGEEALKALAALVKAHPKDHELRFEYARALLTLSHQDQALEQFHVLLKQGAHDPRVTYAVGLLTLEAGYPERAKPYFEQLIKQGHETNAAAYFLGRIAEDAKHYATAAKWYRKTGGQYRERAQLRLAVVLAEQGKLTEARQALAGLRARKPQTAVQAYLVESEILRQADKPEQAFDVLSHALKDHPQDGDLLYGRAMIAVNLGRLAVAEKDLRAIISQDPDNAQALNALGYTLVDMTDRVQEGAELIRKAFAQDSDSAPIIDSMGWAEYKLGRPEKALPYLRKAYDKQKDPEIAAHLGEVLWVLGRHKAAQEVWDEGLKQAPGNESIHKAMQRLKQ